MSITKEQAHALLMVTVEEAEKRLKKTLVLHSLGENQYSALVSIVFNCGTLLYKDKFSRKWKSTTLLSAVNSMELDKAAKEIYDDTNGVKAFKATAKGVTLPGLLRRRKAERALFDTLSTRMVTI